VSKRKIISSIVILVIIGAGLSSAQTDPQSGSRAVNRIGAAGVGQELKTVQEEVLSPKSVERSEAREEGSIMMSQDERDELRVDLDPTATNVIETIEVAGDQEFLREQGVMRTLRSRLIGKSLETAYVQDVLDSVLEGLYEEGYYLASLWIEPEQTKNGTLTLAFDKGRIGNVSIQYPGAVNEGKYYSRRQIEKRLLRLAPGSAFDYTELRNELYDINSHPDLTLNTDLKVRKEMVDDRITRYIDMEFEVKESLPLHAMIDFNNYGTDASGNWGVGLTVQHLNLTKRDDVLTFSMPFSLDFESLNSYAASYYLPYYIGQKRGAFTLYGGYSDLDADDVIEGIDVKGEGWFAGAQASFGLIDTPAHLWTVSLGAVQRYVEEELIVEDLATQPRDVTIRPMSVAFTYTGKKNDALGGRNFLTLESSFNKGDFAGTSDDEEVQLQRLNAEADYFIQRAQYARLQPFGGSASGGWLSGQWIVYLKLTGQYASGPLIPAEQIGIGGASSVRGYLEREFLGDDAATGTLELQTPILLGALSAPFTSHDYQAQHRREPIDRLRFLIFVDGGYSHLKEALADEEASQTIASAGAGLRLGLTSSFQAKLDWGFPFSTTDETDQSGRGSINLQLQF
jgi:hemolysin activation/secretion protein